MTYTPVVPTVALRDRVAKVRRPLTREQINVWARALLALVPDLEDAEVDAAVRMRDGGFTPEQTAVRIRAQR